MIITCACKKKQFKIDSSLIPNEGRKLQCGSCEKIWFYKPKNSIETPLNLEDNISSNNEVINNENKFQDKENKSTNIGFKFFSYLIVFIISFVALIIILDTFKSSLSSIFPNLELILFNLIETLKDIKFFIKDLFY